MKFEIFGYLFVMWVLILMGGGIIVTLLGPISVVGFEEFDWFIGSVIKATSAIFLVITWILILTKLKNWIFKKYIKF